MKPLHCATRSLNALTPDSPRVLRATGKLVGEGFDHPPLDTLILAMPISRKGTLQQYAGRLHREHATKTVVRIIDFMNTGHSVLMRMWDKSERGYRAMGYRIAESPQYYSGLKDHLLFHQTRLPPFAWTPARGMQRRRPTASNF